MLSFAELPITECANVIEVLRMRVKEQPARLAFTFLADGDVEVASFNYDQLDRHARALGALFQQLNAQGERALMIYPPCVDTIAAFLGCLYGGVIAAPVVPPQPGRVARSMPRLEAVVKDANARFVLTTASLLAELKAAATRFPELEKAEWIATDTIDTGLAADWQFPDVSGDTLAYLQYTSGSTSIPKGVMVSHDNIMKICAYDSRLLDYRQEEGASVCWMPYFHDYGLVDGLIFPLYNGIPSYLMSPLAFVQQPIRWLRAISRYRASNSAGPNFAYDLCVRKTTPEQRASLDLSCWRSTSNAAEPIRKKTIERFVEAFAPCGFSRENFYPAYGLAESTLIVSARQTPVFYSLQAKSLEKGQILDAPDNNEESVRTLVGCGLVANDMFDTRLLIVNPETMKECPPDQIGEIWIGGELVAQGYWNKSKETVETFQAHLADTGQGPFLRTGDLGFIKDGEVVVAGRLKDLIIIEGRNHYPQDIEKTVEETHAALRPGCSIAFSIVVDDQERLVVAVEVRSSGATSSEQQSGPGPEASHLPSAKQLLKQIRAAVVEEHDVYLHAVVLLKTGTIPKTSSGKLQRQDCRARYLNNSLELWQANNDNN